jgi:hypothetical protein
MPSSIIGGTIFRSMKANRVILREIPLKHTEDLTQFAGVCRGGDHADDPP